ncbi:DNA-binding protein WhiA [Actinomyces sp. 2119]|uniref:Probable cell division protein WhiA n=1 Tax=Actinomyces lilanjuaniae TaxID=2321394 RepID=A0ABN5PNB5_9ACTO|nr:MULTISPECIES: DNA-binding protein WhiA [Actinomyces]AYD89817.1 DNA-binding protein WhiA [Actinomyces lilanjuaniae]RJF44800.1 DNA-binding protein WhiA [Actinomyces sp. 2119]
MSLTVTVKDELSGVVAENTAQKRAEVSAMLRFAGGLHIVSQRLVVEVELDHGATVRRLHRYLRELFGMDAEVLVVQGGSLHRGSRYLLRVADRGKDLARLSGLVDEHGRPVRGMPVAVVQGGRNAAAAAWRGAFLARGSLTEPGRSSSLEVTCPGSEAALALVGAARRFDVVAKAREVRGADRVVVRDGESIGIILDRMGAPEANRTWSERRSRRESRGTANRLANFDDANLRRSARAAVASGARVERAFEILGDDVPAHLLQAGRLRMEHKQASLEELGHLSDPQLTKDAVAGRIRRLLAMADKRAHDLGVPDTESVLTQDMLDP